MPNGSDGTSPPGSGSGSILRAKQTAEFFKFNTFAERVNNDNTEPPGQSAEGKKNTALVICFDDNADQEALRNPFAKKPRLRGKGSGTPVTKLTVPQAEASIKVKTMDDEKMKPHEQSAIAIENKVPKVNKNKDDMRIEIFFDDDIAASQKGTSKTPGSIAEAFLAKRKPPTQID